MSRFVACFETQIMQAHVNTGLALNKGKRTEAMKYSTKDPELYFETDKDYNKSIFDIESLES